MGDAKDGDVGHAGGANQGGFDLGGVNVDAARNDHVDLAVRQEQESIFVQVSDVADREVVIEPVLLGLLLVLVVLELLARHHEHVDGAHLACGQFVHVVVEDLDIRCGPRVANSPRVGKPVFG